MIARSDGAAGGAGGPGAGGGGGIADYRTRGGIVAAGGYGANGGACGAVATARISTAEAAAPPMHRGWRPVRVTTANTGGRGRGVIERRLLIRPSRRELGAAFQGVAVGVHSIWDRSKHRDGAAAPPVRGHELPRLLALFHNLYGIVICWDTEHL